MLRELAAAVQTSFSSAAEFVERVQRFQGRMDTLPDGTVIFGHGIWLAMLQWHLEGQGVTDTAGMRAFREFQLQLPMPNCAVFEVARHGAQPWRMERVPWLAESEYAHG